MSNIFLNKTNTNRKLEINTSNFPELVNNSSKQSNVKQSNIITEVNKKPSFLDKINTEKVNIEKDELINSHVKLQDGWVEFKRDRSNGKIITNYSKKVISDTSSFYNVLERLVSLQEKRKQEYIKNWGEDEYEKMFIFPNYEYGYFDRLDEEEYEKNNQENSYYDYNYHGEYYSEYHSEYYDE